MFFLNNNKIITNQIAEIADVNAGDQMVEEAYRLGIHLRTQVQTSKRLRFFQPSQFESATVFEGNNSAPSDL